MAAPVVPTKATLPERNPPSAWQSLLPSVIAIGLPNFEIEAQKRAKRVHDEFQIDSDSENDLRPAKKQKYWKAHSDPAIIPSEKGKWKWYLGIENSKLFIRQCTVDCFDVMWKAFEKIKIWTPTAFIITGPPGLGKSWSSNTIVMLLSKKRQNMWFHSASEHTLTTIEFEGGDKYPTITERPEKDALTFQPPTGTWFLYDSVGGSGSSQGIHTFRARPAGVPCIIFSSPKDTNYKQGIKTMSGAPGGGKIWRLWMPSWEWHELEAVMGSLYEETLPGKSDHGYVRLFDHVKCCTASPCSPSPSRRFW